MFNVPDENKNKSFGHVLLLRDHREIIVTICMIRMGPEYNLHDREILAIKSSKDPYVCIHFFLDSEPREKRS